MIHFRNKIVLPIVAILGLSGCAVAPTVELSRISKPSDVKGDEIDTFYLRKSIIQIDKTGTTKDAEGKPIDTLEIKSLVSEHDDFKIGVRRADTTGVRTNLNITKIANTELIQEAGVEVDDKRVELINKVGAIVTKLVPVAFDATQGLQAGALPKTIKTSVLLEGNGIKRDSVKDVDAADGVSIDFGKIPPDAIAIEDFVTPTKMSGLIYSSCRSATIKFAYGEKKYEKTVKINDPRYIQRIAFPAKGKVSFHTECGVSVASEKDTGISTSADIVDALATQGKAIKDAIDAAKKEDK